MFFWYFYGMKAFNHFAITLTFSLLISLFSVGQENGRMVYKDSIRNIQLLDTLVLENFGGLRICFGGPYNCKGFISEFDTSEVDLGSKSIRAIIKHIDSTEFEIKYKFRKSEDFLVERFKIYCSNGNHSLAVPISSDNLEFDESSLLSFIASSSDERDVVYAILEEGEIVLYGMESYLMNED
ncbi:MAG: hypothetical protein COA32_10360 [Fluviicola sp.]|nr:MAG: hypothetical protein COA32_10360 [Fluviicola sp.]